MLICRYNGFDIVAGGANSTSKTLQMMHPSQLKSHDSVGAHAYPVLAGAIFWIDILMGFSTGTEVPRMIANLA